MFFFSAPAAPRHHFFFRRLRRLFFFFPTGKPISLGKKYLKKSPTCLRLVRGGGQVRLLPKMHLWLHPKEKVFFNQSPTISHNLVILSTFNCLKKKPSPKKLPLYLFALRAFAAFGAGGFFLLFFFYCSFVDWKQKNNGNPQKADHLPVVPREREAR